MKKKYLTEEIYYMIVV